MAGGGVQDELWAAAAEAAAERRGRSAGVSAQEAMGGSAGLGAPSCGWSNSHRPLQQGLWSPQVHFSPDRKPNNYPSKTVEILSPVVHGQARVGERRDEISKWSIYIGSVWGAQNLNCCRACVLLTVALI